jgi:hypothetical protein
MCYMYRRRRYCHSPVVGLTGPGSCRYPPIQTGLNRLLDRIRVHHVVFLFCRIDVADWDGAQNALRASLGVIKLMSIIEEKFLFYG